MSGKVERVRWTKGSIGAFGPFVHPRPYCFREGGDRECGLAGDPGEGTEEKVHE